MKIIAKRPFISSKNGLGNVPEGRVFDVDDNYARMLIKSGLAEEYSAAPILKAEGQTSFISPVGANIKNGQSLPAGQALRKQTARKSKYGGK